MFNARVSTPGLLAAAVLGLAVITLPVMAGHGHKHGSLDKCLKTVHKVKSGSFIKAEYLIVTDEGKPAYEIEVRDDDGNVWEFECNAKTAAIIEIEREVDGVDDPLFQERMQVSENDARATATALYPGEVEEVEYEIETHGEPMYEFDIVDSGGTEWKVEVSAESGQIDEVQIETWEIGAEDVVK